MAKRDIRRRRLPVGIQTLREVRESDCYYASVFYAYFASLGLDLTPEESSNAGRLDMALRFNGQVYLFEFKVVELASEGASFTNPRKYFTFFSCPHSRAYHDPTKL